MLSFCFIRFELFLLCLFFHESPEDLAGLQAGCVPPGEWVHVVILPPTADHPPSPTLVSRATKVIHAIHGSREGL